MPARQLGGEDDEPLSCVAFGCLLGWLQLGDHLGVLPSSSTYGDIYRVARRMTRHPA